jgi:hypothetical protein
MFSLAPPLQETGPRVADPDYWRPWLDSRATAGLRRTDAGWKITHEHTSTPFYMDGSGRAATDLQPQAGNA